MRCIFLHMSVKNELLRRKMSFSRTFGWLYCAVYKTCWSCSSDLSSSYFSHLSLDMFQNCTVTSLTGKSWLRREYPTVQDETRSSRISRPGPVQESNPVGLFFSGLGREILTTMPSCSTDSALVYLWFRFYYPSGRCCVPRDKRDRGSAWEEALVLV